MLKKISIIIILSLILNGCVSNPPENVLNQPLELQEIKPTHSILYNHSYTQDEIITFFEEVVLNIEYSDGIGNPSLVQKWNSSIYYQLYGNYTTEDLDVLNDLFYTLNEIPGFPGIYATDDHNQENLSLYFLDANTFTQEFSNTIQGEDAYGATEFWYYTDSNEIYTARIGYRTDIEQQIRNSILIEEIINALGINDTELYPESIVYQYSDENLNLSNADLIILKLLYDPMIKNGMNINSCNEIIKQLYY